MKTPWSRLLAEYGAGIATTVVMVCAAAIFLGIVGVAVILSKILSFIK